MRTPKLRYSLFPYFALAGLMACSGGTPETTPAQGGGSSVGGSTASANGGSVTTASGGYTAPASGGSSAAPEGGSVSTAQGGSTDGTDPSVGGAASPSGGTVGSAGGGTAPVNAGGAPPAATPGVIPAGYPTPTAANVAKCTTAPMVAGLCPGGGPGPVCMQCLFGSTVYGESTTTPTAEGTMMAGNYLVTAKVGGAAAGQTYLGAESSRGLLQPVSTTAGQSVDYAFVVNVRAMEGQPSHAGGPSGYPGLDIFFSGTAPQVSAIGFALATPATKPVMVYIASDSTACDQTGNAFGGWGQMLPPYFNAPVGISNYANSGASSGSFGPFWNQIKAKWTAGDFVLIQFGHNDKGIPDATVQKNLENFAADAIAAQVTPIIISPPARVQFQGTMDGDQSSLHAAAAKAAAAAKQIAYIDLTALSTAWYNTLGSQAAALKFHANGSDATHTNLVGADKLAGLITADMKRQSLPLAKYLR